MPSDSEEPAVDWDSLQTLHTFDGGDAPSGDPDRKYEVKFGECISRENHTLGLEYLQIVNVLECSRFFDAPHNHSHTVSLRIYSTTDYSNPNQSHQPHSSTSAAHNGSTQLVAGAGFGPSSTFIDHITHNASTPVSLLVESLVQQLCSMLDTDPQRSSQLYMRICEQLHQMRLIDRTYAMGEFELMRSQYQRALYQLVSVARGQELPLPVQSVWPLTQPIGMDWSRYHREFDEVAFVAGGGFGKVFSARHRLDGIVYAVKKVTIKSITIGKILSHLAEVKTLAGLNHQNVVSYKAAWLEPLLEDPEEARNRRRDRRRLRAASGAGSRMETENGNNGHEDVDENDENDDDDDSEEEESEFDASMESQTETTAGGTATNSFTADDESSGFIHFESSHASESRAGQSAVVQRYSATTSTHHIAINQSSQTSHTRTQTPRSRQMSVFNETQSRLNLKWATLYIQMTLCHQTLREWLDERNRALTGGELDAESFAKFYAGFRTKSASNLSADNSVDAEVFAEDAGNGDTNSGTSIVDVSHEIFVQLVTGLEYIHSRGIIHHDIKPSNVFVGLEQSGRLSVQLGDFGLACPLQMEHRSADVVGTPTYAAPEQLKGCCDPKSDIYSLGVVLVELMMPFGTDMERIRTIEMVRRNEVPEKFTTAYATLLTE